MSTAALATDARRASAAIHIAKVPLIADCSGALYWPEQSILVVADLHLEKGSSFAARGVLLPPYDTAATLVRLASVVARYKPRMVIALGDSFHDGEGPQRLSASDRAALAALQRGRDWIWIAGNHDPAPPANVGGSAVATLAIGPLILRHQPSIDAADGEIAGHLHPHARINGRGRSIRRRCFAADARRLVMPAFGAFAEVFGSLHFTAHMLGENRLYAFVARRCVAD
jgi:DNA ligase-associated metallophosphoesterase